MSSAYKCVWAPNKNFTSSLFCSVTCELDFHYTVTFCGQEVGIYATNFYPGKLGAH